MKWLPIILLLSCGSIREPLDLSALPQNCYSTNWVKVVEKSQEARKDSLYISLSEHLLILGEDGKVSGHPLLIDDTKFYWVGGQMLIDEPRRKLIIYRTIEFPMIDKIMSLDQIVCEK